MGVNHTTIRNQNLFCLNCGGEHRLNMPIPISEMTEKIEAFNILHKNCPKTWEEKIPEQSLSIEEKANQWIAKGEHGLSSKAMWCVFMGVDGNKDHPHDPDDFSRCYKLLQYVPEWKNQMWKMRKISTPWNRLVDNWDRLTLMYENKDKSMYDLMKKILE